MRRRGGSLKINAETTQGKRVVDRSKTIGLEKINEERAINGSQFVFGSDEIPNVSTIISQDFFNMVGVNAYVANNYGVNKERKEDIGK